MKVLITGAKGFIGLNLRLRLQERNDVEVVCFSRDQQVGELPQLLEGVDFVFHLAGVNRPKDISEFTTGNTNLTRDLCHAVAGIASTTGKSIPVLFASSVQASLDTPYGQSKRDAEAAVAALGQEDPLVPVHVFRLPNVFGKWCKPNYNSVVATFCHNICRKLPIRVNDANASMTLVYIDDVVEQFLNIMDGGSPLLGADGFASVHPQYATTVGELASLIQAFYDSRGSLVTERVGTGLARALYATYVSYLPVDDFSYNIPQYADKRGVFVEILKTPDCGQFSFFTAHPGQTRGGHYHHSKTEKFLVIKGQGLFRFRHMLSGETHELTTSGDKPQIVDTVPGWTHDITNTGADEMLVMLWANEIFDRARPDTFSCPL